MAEKSGLYIHIPFCKSKCPYCDFYSVRYDKNSALEYIEKVKKLMSDYSGEFDTVYFGGGTPSILEPYMLEDILECADKHFSIDPSSEITIECNPSKNLQNDFKEYARLGINRISLGMQSARNEERFALGRIAGKAEVKKAVFDAKSAGISNISLDVMLGTPKQTLDSLDETFEFIEQADVTHISAYMLKIENGTKFYDMQSKLDLPDDDTVCDMYLKTIDALKKIGFNQYEISNFSKPGFESKHNTKYWKLVPYLGLGASAHSFYNGKRFYFDKDLHIINDGTGGGNDERIMLGLRLNEGINESLLKNKDVSAFVKAGLIIKNNGKISLTPQGMLVSNQIISELID